MLKGQCSPSLIFTIAAMAVVMRLPYSRMAHHCDVVSSTAHKFHVVLHMSRCFVVCWVTCQHLEKETNMWQDIICKQEYISYCCVDFRSMSNDLCYHSDKNHGCAQLSEFMWRRRLALSLAASVCAKRVLSVIIPGNGTWIMSSQHYTANLYRSKKLSPWHWLVCHLNEGCWSEFRR